MMSEIQRELFDFMVGWRDDYEELVLRATPMIAQRIETYEESERQISSDDCTSLRKGIAFSGRVRHPTSGGGRGLLSGGHEGVRDHGTGAFAS